MPGGRAIRTPRPWSRTDSIYTPAFRQELRRRYRILFTEEEFVELLRSNAVDDLDGLLEKTLRARPEAPLPQARSVRPIDEWKARSGR